MVDYIEEVFVELMDASFEYDDKIHQFNMATLIRNAKKQYQDLLSVVGKYQMDEIMGIPPELQHLTERGMNYETKTSNR